MLLTTGRDENTFIINAHRYLSIRYQSVLERASPAHGLPFRASLEPHGQRIIINCRGPLHTMHNVTLTLTGANLTSATDGLALGRTERAV
ncbi:hypothetical protein EVAR_49276_1 [Eumeta japonica]|uniref:Uncharacterized protein n=1 Tax=Eumeta variegata TaxID=151549 RepID=A0A4C1XMW7_EUMVA|nr:hypothetical protein EVAR_49276_1 [Eumeta japonica]